MSDIQDEAYTEAMAEIERLKEKLAAATADAAELAWFQTDAKKLIHELADALKARIPWHLNECDLDDAELVRRAREAVK
jgi:hypothetical protein